MYGEQRREGESEQRAVISVENKVSVDNGVSEKGVYTSCGIPDEFYSTKDNVKALLKGRKTELNSGRVLRVA